MKSFWKRSRSKSFDVETELLAMRSEGRPEFVQELGERVRSSEAPRTAPWGRTGMALGLTGLLVVAIASFGGVGYASSAANEAVKTMKKATGHNHHARTHSSAAAQYGQFPHPKKKGHHKNRIAVAGAVAQAKPIAAVKTSSQLPFTGVALLVPLFVGIALLTLGVLLRTYRPRARARK